MKKYFFLSAAAFLTFLPATYADFTDIGGLSSRSAVEFLQEQEVVNGFSDGTFRPENNITRAEFLKIALKSKEEVLETCDPTKTFSDVHENEWYYNIVCYAVNNGIVSGYSDGTFRPNDSINFRDGAKIISEVHDVEVPEDAGEEWFSGYLAAIERERVKPGSITDSAQQLKRGEMSEIIWGLVTGNEVENENLGELPEIASCEDLNAQLSKYEKRNLGYSNMFFRGAVPEMALEMEEAVMEDAASGAAVSSKSTASDDYSQTNVQEAGVDEADIIKNDGSHIFLAKRNTVRIIDAYPSTDLAQVATITLDKNENAQDLFLDGNTLTVISNNWGGRSILYETIEEDMARSSMPYSGGGNNTIVTVYDVSDRENPQELRKVTFEGNYLSSRRVGDMVYLVAQKGWSYWGVPRPIPYETMIPAFADTAFESEKKISDCTGIRYFPNFENANYLIVAGIDTKDTSKKVEREVVLGGGSEVYSSTENLYVTRPSHHQEYVESDDYFGWIHQENTEVYKFSLENGDIDFDAKGRVPGRVLNQFAMSEYGDNFRIATQRGYAWSGGRPSSSGVYILDSDLEELSRVENIAPGENMKSARFMGDKGYLVTFKTVDPLFVIDLNPSNPQILGKLKIPGWSDYLHPYDENHLIGFGKEVDESIDADKVHSDNAIYYTAVLGMKLSIFDVSDLENPVETHKLVIGDRGTQSAILQNHKALLFDKNKSLLGFPVTVTENKNGKTGYDADIQTIFSGAHIYDISLEDGFELRGAASHYDSDEFYDKSGEYFYGDQNLNIERILYIGDTFYTVSPNVVKALDWNTLAEKNAVTLDALSCEEIRSENACIARSDCRAMYYNSSACYKETEDGELICEEPRFSYCQVIK